MSRIIASLKPAVRHVVGKYNLAYMACIVNATQFPNVHIVRNFVDGFLSMVNCTLQVAMVRVASSRSGRCMRC